MRDLVTRVELDDRLPLAVESQEVEMVKAQLLAPLLRPILVPVVGQQLSAVHGERGSRRGDVGVGERPSGEALELHHVDHGLGLGAEGDGVAAEHDRVRHVDGAAREVGGLVQLRRGFFNGVVGPEEVEHLLPVQSQARSEREHLDERGRVPPGPVALVDSDRVDGHTELSEHRHADLRHRS